MAYTFYRYKKPPIMNKSNSGIVYTDEWIVDSDVELTVVEVKDIVEIPPLNTRFEQDRSAILTQIRAEPREGEDGFKWTVFLDYNTASGANTVRRGDFEDPTKRKPEINFGTYTEQRAVTGYYMSHGETPGTLTKGQPTKLNDNSAGDMFTDPPWVQPESRDVLNIKRNERKYLADTKRLYKGSINLHSVRVAGRKLQPFQGWMRNVTGTRKIDAEGEFYFEVRYEVAVAEGDYGWLADPLDIGFYTLVGGKRIAIRESDLDSSITAGSKKDTKVTVPQNLDGNGGLVVAPLVAITFRRATLFPIDWKTLKLPQQETD